MGPYGTEVHGELNHATPSTARAIPLYDPDGTVVTVGSTERLVITDIQVVSTPGGDIYVFVGADATPAVGEYVVRGTVAANGGIVMHFIGTPWMGILGGSPWLLAPDGVTDVILTGRIQIT